MPCLVQMVWREGAASVLQLPACRPDRGHVQLHVRLLGCAATLFKVTVQASGGDIFPAGDAAQATWNDMVKGQIVT